MSLKTTLIAALFAAPLMAQTPVTSNDRVYTGDQTSNTVSVIDPATQTLAGEIVLGAPRSDVLSPIYRGEANVHGLGFSPDHRTLVVVSVATNSVTFIDTATSTVRGKVYIGRAPHEAFFTNDGREVWATVRGESHISVIDAATMKEKRKVTVADGPGMVRFSLDGKRAFVVSSFTPEVDVVRTDTYEIEKRIPVVSPFSPNLDVCSDGNVWMTHKDVGKVTVIDGTSLEVRSVIDTGPITNHVACVDNSAGHFAFVTVGGLNQVKVFSREATPAPVGTISTGALPHGIWPSGDGTRVFVGLENDDAVEVIDAVARKSLRRIPSGQAPQALVYVSNAVPAEGSSANLKPLSQVIRPVTLTLLAPSGSDSKGRALVSVRALGIVDAIDVSLAGLEPNTVYALVVAHAPQPPYGETTHLLDMKTNPKGGGNGAALGPVREIVVPAAEPADSVRYLIVVPAKDRNAAPLLIGKIAS
jgi:YVTN family beta-propeller protein